MDVKQVRLSDLEDMEMPMFHDFIDELRRQYPVDEEAVVHTTFEDEITFMKLVADSGNYKLYMYFDIDGVPTDAFVFPEDDLGNSYDSDKVTDFLSNIRLTKHERSRCVCKAI